MRFEPQPFSDYLRRILPTASWAGCVLDNSSMRTQGIVRKSQDPLDERNEGGIRPRIPDVPWPFRLRDNQPKVDPARLSDPTQTRGVTSNFPLRSLQANHRNSRYSDDVRSVRCLHDARRSPGLRLPRLLWGVGRSSTISLAVQLLLKTS